MIERPETRRCYAWALLRNGNPEDTAKARTLLTEAIDQYRTIGMPRHIELAEELLART